MSDFRSIEIERGPLDPDIRGFSLVELVVVIVIIAVVSSFALYQFTAPRKIFARQNISRELKVALERARFDSVKRRAADPAIRARVVVSSSSFKLETDRDDDGTIEASEALVNSFSGQPYVIAGVGFSLPATVSYDQRGEVTAVDAVGDPVTPVFRICYVNCASPNNANSDLLLVTPTGTVNLLGGGQAIPTFSSPPVTDIDSDSGINPLVTVPSN